MGDFCITGYFLLFGCSSRLAIPILQGGTLPRWATLPLLLDGRGPRRPPSPPWQICTFANSQFISGNDQLITCIPARSPASTPAMLSSMTRQFSGETGGGSNLCQDIKEKVVMQVEPAGCHCEYVGVRLPARHLRVIAAIHLHEELAFFLFLKMEPPCGWNTGTSLDGSTSYFSCSLSWKDVRSKNRWTEMDWMVWKKYPFPPAWGSNSQWDSIGVEMCDQLCGARLGLAGGKQGGQLVVQLGYQLTIKARLNMNKFMGKIIKKKIKKITHSSTTRTKTIKD